MSKSIHAGRFREYLWLWMLYFRSKLNPKKSEDKAAAREYLQRSVALTQRVMDAEFDVLQREAPVDVLDKDLMLSIELQFLWGFFHEFVHEYPNFPTSGYDRAKLHLIERLRLRTH